MNLNILNKDVQEFIDDNATIDIAKLVLKKQLFPEVSNVELAEQIEAKNRCKNKLPTWYNTKSIYYPNKLNIEQTSSEITAEHKLKLVSGDSILDLTGGFGVDSFYFSKRFREVVHCEVNTNLSRIVGYNFDQLKNNNIEIIKGNGFEFLRSTTKKFDCIYVDPSRRNSNKGKVFFLKDCLPNLPEEIENLFKHTETILVKASPMLDIQVALTELRNVTEIHIVAVNNEVKELLFIMKKNSEIEIERIKINTINIGKVGNEKFNFNLNNERNSDDSIGPIKKYLYEPNSAILKSGAYKYLAKKYKLTKLHQHTHLYTSNDLINFPGKKFSIETIIPFNKRRVRSAIGGEPFNIVTRNFSNSSDKLKSLFKTKEGDLLFAFFVTDNENKKVVIKCKKI